MARSHAAGAATNSSGGSRTSLARKVERGQQIPDQSHVVVERQPRDADRIRRSLVYEVALNRSKVRQQICMRQRHRLGITAWCPRRIGSMPRSSAATPISSEFVPPRLGRGHTAEAGSRELNRGAQEPADAFVGHDQGRIHRPQHGRRLRVVFLESSQPDGWIQRNRDGSGAQHAEQALRRTPDRSAARVRRDRPCARRAPSDPQRSTARAPAHEPSGLRGLALSGSRRTGSPDSAPPRRASRSESHTSDGSRVRLSWLLLNAPDD